MTVFKKSLAMFLAVLLAFSSLSISVFAVDLCYYTVETYFMNTRGNYAATPDGSVHKYTTAGSEVQIQIEDVEGFTPDTSKSDTVIEVNEDGSSVAKVYYQRNKYTLTYYYEDLIGPQIEDSEVYFGAEIPGFEANPSGKPSKPGHNFIMWSTDPEERVEAPAVMPANDVDLFPIYEIKTYTYTFDAGNGGLFPNGEQIVTFDYVYGDVPETPDDPSMDDYEFVDWDKDIPLVVESNMVFNAMYNELTYSVIFMDGDEELSYSDGYYSGDLIEEIDVPEGYEAWTLSDGTYVQFPYEIKGDTYFYAAEAQAEYTARFYLDINDTEPYAVYIGVEGSEIEFPDDPELEGYKFAGWTSDITVMPDEDIDFIAEWEFIGNKIPEDYLGLKTELYTYDETVGDWVVADRVERGETVKARFFIESGFGIGDGQVLFFYNDDAFESDYAGAMHSIVVNESLTSTTGQYYVNGGMTAPSKNHPSFKNLVDHGYITEEFLENHTPVTFSFYFTDFLCHTINGDEWFAEFELTAKIDAVGKGDFYIVPATIQNPDDGYYAYIDFAKGEDGASALDNTESLADWNASINVESYPVSTGYGRLILDAGEGTFADGSSLMKLDFVAGTQISGYSEPNLEGYIFGGFEPEIPDSIDDEVIRTKATWIPADDTVYKIIVHYVDFEDGEIFEYEEELEFEGITDSVVEIVDAMPESPEPDTEYILVEDLAMNDYNIVDISAENIISAVIAADGSTVLEIFFKLASYEVEFYADEGSFPGGSNTVTKEAVYGTPALSIVPEDKPRRRGYIFAGWHGIDENEIITEDAIYYALWEAEKSDFNVYFIATGDVPESFTLPVSYSATEGEFIIVPEECSAEGYEFDGWYYNGTRYDCGSQFLMPSENVTFICKWKRIAVEPTTQPSTTEPTTTEPVVTEPTTTKPTTTKPVVTEPTTKPAEPTTKPQKVVFEIRKPSVTTINYGDSIILHLDIIEGELPYGSKIVWSADNGNFKIVSTAEDGSNCMITPNSKGDTIITVTILDKDGKEIGNDTQTMTSKAGFFQKLIAFFKKLFGLTKIIPEAFRPVFEK